MSKAWIGVDLDGTLAEYTGWKGIEHIGKPIEPIVAIVKLLLRAGVEVKIFTARVQEGQEAIAVVENWSHSVFGQILEVTATKDFGMVYLVDDRAVAVEKNTGKLLTPFPTLERILWHRSPENPDNPEATKAVPQADGDHHGR